MPAEREEKPKVKLNTARVIRMSECPVIAIEGNQLPLYRSSVMLPPDLTKNTRQKTGLAIRKAEMSGDGNNPAIKAGLQNQVDEVKETIVAAGIQCTICILETPDGEQSSEPSIPDYPSKQGDIILIVIMTRQESALVEFFVGSHAREYIRNAEIPVMSAVPEETGS